MRIKVLTGGLALVVAVGVVAGVGVAAEMYIARSEKPETTVVHCTSVRVNHRVYVENGQLSQTSVIGHLCDTLTITNEDDRLRLMAFGVHSHHQAYDGVTEKLLSKGQSLTITFDRLGEYTFHDHLQDSVKGYFAVSK